LFIKRFNEGFPFYFAFFLRWHIYCNSLLAKLQKRREEMKKIMFFLAGLGLALILTAGNFENCLAEEKDSVSRRYTFSSDSPETLSLEERAKNNSIYLKPGPVKPEKVVGEFLLGGVGAVLVGGIGSGIGYNITYDPGEDGWMNFSGLPGAIVGYLVGSNVGCATGVYLIGKSGGEKGSYPATLGGSLAGTLVGGLIAISLFKDSDDDEALFPFVVFTAAQAGGATTGFNLSRKGKKIETSSEALLNLNDEKLSLAFPEVDIFQDNLGSDNYKVNLFHATF